MCSPSVRFAAVFVVAAVAVQARPQRVDPERLLAERFQFSAADVSQVRAGAPVVKVTSQGDELSIVGASRLPGGKERLAGWVKNIEHFRRSAELGVAQVVATPPAPAGFAGLTLDQADLDALETCTANKCDIRLSPTAEAALRRDGVSRANAIFRQMLVEETAAYLEKGKGPETHALLQRAATLGALAPELVAFFDRYPAATLPSSDQLFYWSSTPAGSVSIVSVHHLVLYRPRADETWIVDRNVYASRYFDAGVLVIGLYDAPDGTGFYAVAGSRVRVSRLNSAAGMVLRRQIQRSAADTVKMYLEWMRDSLAAVTP